MSKRRYTMAKKDILNKRKNRRTYWWAGKSKSIERLCV